MMRVKDGQCGLCTYFGDHQAAGGQKIEEIRKTKQAPEALVEPCVHPKLNPLSLRVTPVSGCNAFEPAVR